MLFQKKVKKELWRCVLEIANGPISQQPQPHRLQHQLPLQLCNHQALERHHQAAHSPPMLMCESNQRLNYDYLCHQPSPMVMDPSHQHNTPPPPYSSMSIGIDCSGSQSDNRRLAQDVDTDTSMISMESDRSCLPVENCSKDGSNYESSCVDMPDEQEKANMKISPLKLAKRHRKELRQAPFTTNAATVFLNCCGGGPPNSSSPCSEINKACCVKHQQTMLTYSLREYFDGLMRQLGKDQVKTLCKVVNKRLNPAATSRKGTSEHSCCILIPRALICNEEPYVIACRLFFWTDLRDASELKRSPICPNSGDPIYVCCNPFHWCRILQTEITPPPYQGPVMERLTAEDTEGNSQNDGNSHTNVSRSICSINPKQLSSGVRVLDSLTTDGRDGRPYSSIWCEVAYWEMKQRVGKLYLAEQSSINIYAERSCSDLIGQGMCLKDLVEQEPSPTSVHHTRQKIGLGVILSQEIDGVWLYNRSTAPVFVHSPTLSSCSVLKVMPGSCLKAFEIKRAQLLCYSPQYLNQQPGPVNPFSMRISFAKGWGDGYKRTEITRCPCWLEVHFAGR